MYIIGIVEGSPASLSSSSNNYQYKQNNEVFKQIKQNRSLYRSYPIDVILETTSKILLLDVKKKIRFSNKPNVCLLCRGGGDEQIIMRHNEIKRSDYILSVANHFEMGF